MFRPSNNTIIAKIERYSVAAVIVIIATIFLVSLHIGQINQIRNSPPKPEEIIKTAELFLPGSDREELGTKLDCSGYTRTVYTEFNIRIPTSAAGQYKVTTHVDRSLLSPGDLLFFNTSGSGISHVALCLDSSRFIHSPGRGKKICVDSFEQLYWDKRFICGGKINIYCN